MTQASSNRVQPGTPVLYWPGDLVGMGKRGTALTGPVQFGGRECVRIQTESGGTDYIAVSHVRAYV